MWFIRSIAIIITPKQEQKDSYKCNELHGHRQKELRKECQKMIDTRLKKQSFITFRGKLEDRREFKNVEVHGIKLSEWKIFLQWGYWIFVESALLLHIVWHRNDIRFVPYLISKFYKSYNLTNCQPDRSSTFVQLFLLCFFAAILDSKVSLWFTGTGLVCAWLTIDWQHGGLAGEQTCN